MREIKLDGYRMAARIDNGRAQLLMRNELDWTVHLSITLRSLAHWRMGRLGLVALLSAMRCSSRWFRTSPAFNSMVTIRRTGGRSAGPSFALLFDLQNTDDAAGQDDARESRRIVDHHDVKGIAVIGSGQGTKPQSWG
jgi:hypothetical protein